MMKRAKQNTKRGFTLVELLIVVAIMAILVAIFAPQYTRYVERSRQSLDVQAVGNIAGALKTVAIDPIYDLHYYEDYSIIVTWHSNGSGDITVTGFQVALEGETDEEAAAIVEGALSKVLGGNNIRARSRAARRGDVVITFDIDTGRVLDVVSDASNADEDFVLLLESVKG